MMAARPVAQAPLASALPVVVDLDTLHARAQARIRAHPTGVGYHGQYSPLGMVVQRAKHLGGAFRVAALASCQDVLDATDADLDRALRAQRPSPNTPTGVEQAAHHTAAQLQTHRAAIDAMRPRVSLAEQLAAMEHRGFRFTAHGDELRVVAPPGAMTDGDRGLIRENKPGILAHLNALAEVF